MISFTQNNVYKDGRYAGTFVATDNQGIRFCPVSGAIFNVKELAEIAKELLKRNS